jgi:hypothetical protein
LHRQKESHVLSSPPPSPLLSSPMQLKRNPHATKTPRPLHKSQQHKQNQSPTPFLPDYKAKHQGFLWHPKTQTHTHTHTQTKLKQIQQQQPRVAGRGNKWWEVMRKLCSFQGWWWQ